MVGLRWGCLGHASEFLGGTKGGPMRSFDWNPTWCPNCPFAGRRASPWAGKTTQHSTARPLGASPGAAGRACPSPCSVPAADGRSLRGRRADCRAAGAGVRTRMRLAPPWTCPCPPDSSSVPSSSLKASGPPSQPVPPLPPGVRWNAPAPGHGELGGGGESGDGGVCCGVGGGELLHRGPQFDSECWQVRPQSTSAVALGGRLRGGLRRTAYRLHSARHGAKAPPTATLAMV